MMKESDRERYSRQIVLPQIGMEGQEKLLRAKVLCIGAGGLGSPALLYLASAGVGEIGVIDDDRVTLSNLQRQVLFTPEDLGKEKALSAKRRLLMLNPSLKIHAYTERLSPSLAEKLFPQYDLVLDGSDNFATKYLANDACVKFGLPLVYGSVLQFDGQVAVFHAADGPCYRCLFPSPPEAAVPNCEEAGVLGAVTGWVGTAQAMEALKLLLQNPELPDLRGNLLIFDALQARIERIQLRKRSDCPVCSIPPERIHLVPEDRSAPLTFTAFCPDELRELLASGGSIRIIDLREAEEVDLHGALPGAEFWPYSRIVRKQLPAQLNDGRDIILYCATGRRSSAALLELSSHSIPRLAHLAGGYSAWRDTLNRQSDPTSF